MYFFVGDEHFFHQSKKNPHKGVIQYCNRPYNHIDDMHEDIIRKHNEIVSPSDKTIHVGDTSFGTKSQTEEIIRQLNGEHVFLSGCHDRWLRKSAPARYVKKINGIIVHAEHYPMRSWFASFHGSINLHAHCHGKMEPLHRQWDVGVDNNDFYPCSIEYLIRILIQEEQWKDPAH